MNFSLINIWFQYRSDHYSKLENNFSVNTDLQSIWSASLNKVELFFGLSFFFFSFRTRILLDMIDLCVLFNIEHRINHKKYSIRSRLSLIPIIPVDVWIFSLIRKCSLFLSFLLQQVCPAWVSIIDKNLQQQQTQRRRCDDIDKFKSTFWCVNLTEASRSKLHFLLIIRIEINKTTHRTEFIFCTFFERERHTHRGSCTFDRSAGVKQDTFSLCWLDSYVNTYRFC